MTEHRHLTLVRCPISAERKFNFTSHARYRMNQMRVQESDVLSVIADPDITYTDNRPGQTRTVYIGGSLRIPTDPITRTVITVIWKDDFTHRSQRPAQQAA